MTRGGRTKMREAPERRCISTGETRAKAALIRFVVGPDGAVVPDLAAKLPGRGIWVSANRGALEKAVDKGLFARSAKAPVVVPDNLVDTIESGLARRLMDLLSMARKAGDAVAGYEKVKGWLDTGEATVLIQASDGSERGKSRLRAPSGMATFIGVLTSSELGLAFGREHVIHAALAAGGLAEKIGEDARRLSGVREKGGGNATGKAK
ncbi:MAG: RNA-binding protein [Pseudomonadota bacterium]